jgi:pyruvate-ferredoxin/flavodoxin oxidoreductase
MRAGLSQQALAVSSGYWPLLRYDPAARASGENPFALDSGAPRTRFRDYAYGELRYRMLLQTNPSEAEALMRRAEEAVARRWATYEEMAARGG